MLVKKKILNIDFFIIVNRVHRLGYVTFSDFNIKNEKNKYFQNSILA